jgi:hypothetical protein
VGRKPIAEDMPLSVRLSREDLALLDQVSTLKSRSRGDIIRRLIRLALPTAHLTIPAKDTGGDVQPVRAA